MGFEFEGDLYYVSSAKGKMARGGMVDMNALKEMIGETNKSSNRRKIDNAKKKFSN
jgi:predicted amino acid dehydrogenase